MTKLCTNLYTFPQNIWQNPKIETIAYTDQNDQFINFTEISAIFNWKLKKKK